MKRALIWTILTLAISMTATAAETKGKSIQLPDDNAMATLKPGVGVEVVRVNCFPCHSTDYIVRQPGSDAKHWEAEVKKMMTVYGAPISDADAKAISEYLSAAYGPEANATSDAQQKKPASTGKSNAEKK